MSLWIEDELRRLQRLTFDAGNRPPLGPEADPHPDGAAFLERGPRGRRLDGDEIGRNRVVKPVSFQDELELGDAERFARPVEAVSGEIGNRHLVAAHREGEGDRRRENRGRQERPRDGEHFDDAHKKSAHSLPLALRGGAGCAPAPRFRRGLGRRPFL